MAHHVHEHSQAGNVVIDGNPRLFAPHSLSMVYGGGGVYGIAYGAGVAHGLAATGVPVASAPALGTSAGSWVAAALALGLPYEAFDDVQVPSIPCRRSGALADVARLVFGEATHPLVAVSAVCLRSRRRHILDGARYPLADLAAASSAVPALFPPHRVDGRLYVDGGMWSATSVDAAADARHVIVIAPVAGSILGPMGRGAGFLLERELRTWRHRHPDRTITLIRPNKELAALAGHNPFHLFDPQRARWVYPLAVEQGLRWGERLQQGNGIAA